MAAAGLAPGLYFEAELPADPQDPLRTDVGGFAGATGRGPLGVSVRLDGWRAFEETFGGLWPEADTAYAVRGYFENGGRIAHVIRVGEEGGTARCEWFEASSPGLWGNALELALLLERDGASGTVEYSLSIYDGGVLVEHTGPQPFRTEPEAQSPSRLVRWRPGAQDAAALALEGRRRRAILVGLAHGEEPVRTTAAYREALRALRDVPEVALIVQPDLHRDLDGEDQILEFLTARIAEVDLPRDRLLLVDAPPDRMELDEVRSWSDQLAEAAADAGAKAAALYHPYIEVPDPLGGLRSPRRRIAPSGHVAGLISRLDRERGAHHTPANARLEDAFDVVASFDARARGVLNEQHVNVLRCAPARGVQVSGGRTLEREPPHRYVATERLVHRMIRAIRRVAEPLVFERNDVETRLALAQAITTLLLETYRAGALAGARPAEAFRVLATEEQNPPEVVASGVLLCHIEIVPAPPMERIVLRVSLDQDGKLEVFPR